MFETLGIMFNRSFWRSFIIADMLDEAKMMHEYE